MTQLFLFRYLGCDGSRLFTRAYCLILIFTFISLLTASANFCEVEEMEDQF